ncbi:hypothetical protein K402DRAFT_452937 [Aulographum hederae CBS 113979]|uniref:Apple domain-containing protein n=1 Tax=Aulographum hederae CBS 113979 TaxID=1176131 RepID=A0A6G1H4R8_9PEZI|nr:hypothetical protein K402DRAFT_452937 [Aulographum hederae CBS 113979]
MLSQTVNCVFISLFLLVVGSSAVPEGHCGYGFFTKTRTLTATSTYISTIGIGTSYTTTTITGPQSTTTIYPPADFTPIDIGVPGASKKKKRSLQKPPPPKKCTITKTRTITLTSTTSITTISTSTVTIEPPAATYYAACAPSNIASSYNNGSGLFLPLATISGNATILTIDGISSQYDCCARCVTTPNCGACNTYIGLSDPTCFMFIVDERTGDGSGRCVGSQQIGSFGTYKNGIGVVSNGLCGQMVHDPAADYWGE